MFLPEPMPDVVALAQFKIGATDLPAYSRRLGVIDLSLLKLYDRTDLDALLGAVLRTFTEPVTGVIMREVALRSILQDDVRGDRQQRIYLEIENYTASPITFADKTITLYAFLRGELADGDTPEAVAALTHTPLEFYVSTTGGLEMTCQWTNTTVASGSGGVDVEDILSKIVVAQGDVVTAQGEVVFVSR